MCGTIIKNTNTTLIGLIYFYINDSQKGPIARTLGWGMGFCPVFKVSPKFYLRSCCAGCNIVLYCTLTRRESTLQGKLTFPRMNVYIDPDISEVFKFSLLRIIFKIRHCYSTLWLCTSTVVIWYLGYIYINLYIRAYLQMVINGLNYPGIVNGLLNAHMLLMYHRGQYCYLPWWATHLPGHVWYNYKEH